MDVAGTGGGDVAGSGGDGLGGGMNNAGKSAPAGSGGSASAGVGGTGGGGKGGSHAGAGGAGGAGGSGGSGGGGAGGAGGMPAAGSGGTGDECATEYTTASHIMMNVTWPSSIAVKGGSGVVHIWTKTKFIENGDSAALESTSCGSVLPEIQTSALAGNKKILPEIPNAAWDNASMPKFAGTATKTVNGATTTWTINPGVALVGLTMTNPAAAWPARTAISGIDHDGDSNLGITAIPREGNGYSLPPTSLAQSKFVDKMYLATRNVMTLTQASTASCPQSWTGTANVTKFDSHVIGCHVKGGSDCDSTQADFVDSNRTVYTVGSATFDSEIVADDATCTEVRDALPMN